MRQRGWMHRSNRTAAIEIGNARYLIPSPTQTPIYHPAAMKELTSAIEVSVRCFVTDLRSMVSQAALDSVGTAFVGHAAPAAPEPKAVTILPPPRHNRLNRSDAETRKTVAQVLGFIRTHPDVGLGAVYRGLGLDRPIVQDAIGRLIQDQRIKMKGMRRGATYSVA